MVYKLVLLFALLSIVSSQDSRRNVAENVITLSGQGQGKQYTLKTLLGLAQNATGIVDALSQTPNITLFAPTDEAFAELLRTSAPKAENIPDILKYHVLPSVFAPPAKPFQVLPTLLKAPSPLVGLPDGKSQVLGISVGSGVTVSYGLGNAQVIDSIRSSNGIIHVVSKVLVPPQSPSATAVAANLTQLVEGLKKADLVSAVDSAKGVTVFAPFDPAFTAVRVEVGALTTSQLGNVLKYHVVPTVSYSTDFVSGAVKTLQGQTLNITVVDGKIKEVNGYSVRLTDVFTSNGVVHVIEGVLIPKNLDAAPQPTGPNAPKNGSNSPNNNSNNNRNISGDNGANPTSAAANSCPVGIILAASAILAILSM